MIDWNPSSDVITYSKRIGYPCMWRILCAKVMPIIMKYWWRPFSICIYRSEWCSIEQQCCWDVCQISKQCNSVNTQSTSPCNSLWYYLYDIFIAYLSCLRPLCHWSHTILQGCLSLSFFRQWQYSLGKHYVSLVTQAPEQSPWKLLGFCRTKPEFGLIFLILNMII